MVNRKVLLQWRTYMCGACSEKIRKKTPHIQKNSKRSWWKKYADQKYHRKTSIVLWHCYLYKIVEMILNV